MLKGNRIYIVILILLSGALVLAEVAMPKSIDWNLSYMKKDKIPFGTAALYNALPSVFPGQVITEEEYPLYNSLFEKEYRHANYIVINESFAPDKLDSRELLNFVKSGNNAFIAANEFSGKFADTLKLNTNSLFSLGDMAKIDSTVAKEVYNNLQKTRINFVSSSLKNKMDYVYNKGIENTIFSSFDTSKTTVLGINSLGKINFIKVRWGEGNIYLSTVPEAFTNYHFVNEKNMDYCFKALSYLPNQQILWDEYYKVGNVTKESVLRVVFSDPALRTAYYVLMISLILFIIVGVKRQQRIIPVINPLRNTTLDFVDVVGTLYYQTGNHKNIADKKINYFLEYIRSAFRVDTTIYDAQFIERVASLSGIEKQKVQDIFFYFSEIDAKQAITQEELLKLNKMIETFHQESKR